MAPTTLEADEMQRAAAAATAAAALAVVLENERVDEIERLDQKILDKKLALKRLEEEQEQQRAAATSASAAVPVGFSGVGVTHEDRLGEAEEGVAGTAATIKPTHTEETDDSILPKINIYVTYSN